MILSRQLIHSLAALALVAAIGCEANPTEVTAARIAGRWSRLDGLNPYRFTENWNLSTSGTTIRGSGTWSGEACCDGTLSISGSFDPDSIHVVVNLVTTSGAPAPPRSYRFDGALTSTGEMVGLATVNDSVRTNEQLRRQP